MKYILLTFLLLIPSFIFACGINDNFNGEYKAIVKEIDTENYLVQCNYEKGYIVLKSIDYSVKLFVCGIQPVELGEELLVIAEDGVITLQKVN